jgi:hypothetical protein
LSTPTHDQLEQNKNKKKKIKLTQMTKSQREAKDNVI